MQEGPGGAAEGFRVWWAVSVAWSGGEGLRDGAGGACGGGGGGFGLFGEGAPRSGGGAEATSVVGNSVSKGDMEYGEWRGGRTASRLCRG